MKKVDPTIEHMIIRHSLVDNWPVGTVARELNVHHDVVRRVLYQHGQPPQPKRIRSRKIDPYLAFIAKTFEDYPNLHASRLYQMVCTRGYDGGESHFRRLISRLRPRRAPEPFLRLEMLPAEQAQVDWGHFGSSTIGQAKRGLYAFVMTLSWSRMVWLQFFHDMQMANFCRGHIDAFEFFKGVPRQLLYDNLKSAVIERSGRTIIFNEKLLEIASHYGFEPRAAAPARGNEKGRVERSIRYIRTSFFAAREFSDIADLNKQAIKWSMEVSAKRRWVQDDRKRVYEQFEHEKTKMRALPPTPFVAEERVLAKVGRTPYVRFDSNDYSLPAKHVRREVMVLADHDKVRIVVDGEVVSTHPRSFDRRATITNPKHIEQIRDHKRRAKKNSAMHRLVTSAPAAEIMIHRAAQNGRHLGSLVGKLIQLLDCYGASILQSALEEVNTTGCVGFKPVRVIIEKQAREQGRKAVLPIPIKNEVLRNLTVEQGNLSTYDQLQGDIDEPTT